MGYTGTVNNKGKYELDKDKMIYILTTHDLILCKVREQIRKIVF